MGNHGGIISGFLTALFHTVLAVLVLAIARGGDGPYTNVVVFSCVIMLVCCLGVIARSHFSAVLLLVMDLALMALAIAWCVSTVLALRAPVIEADSYRVSETINRVGDMVTLVGAGVSFLLSAWLTRRTARLEKRLRMVK